MLNTHSPSNPFLLTLRALFLGSTLMLISACSDADSPQPVSDGVSQEAVAEVEDVVPKEAVKPEAEPAALVEPASPEVLSPEAPAVEPAAKAVMPEEAPTSSPAAPSSPAKATIIEGTHFTKVDSSIDKVGPLPEVEVMEFFSYMCPHCASLESSLNAWASRQSEYVTLTHVPAFWSTPYERMARTYHALSIMKQEKALRDTIFKAIHLRGARWGSDEDVAAFVGSHGMDADQFLKSLSSFAVKQKMRITTEQFKKFGVKSVPSFVVAGQYATSASQAGSVPKLWETLDYLVENIKAGRL